MQDELQDNSPWYRSRRRRNFARKEIQVYALHEKEGDDIAQSPPYRGFELPYTLVGIAGRYLKILFSGLSF